MVEAKVEAIRKPAEPTYEKGSKDIILTKRELNGLLNQSTILGESLKFELVTNAITRSSKPISIPICPSSAWRNSSSNAAAHHPAEGLTAGSFASL